MGVAVDKTDVLLYYSKIIDYFLLFIFSFWLFSFKSGDPLSLTSCYQCVRACVRACARVRVRVRVCVCKTCTITYTHLAYMLACEMLVILKTLDALSIDGYVSSLSPPKTSYKLYFDFTLNCSIQSVKCVCFDIDNHTFLKKYQWKY